MAYRKPFTPSQRREALGAYRSYRNHRSRLRRDYPPTGPEQKRIFSDYTDAIRELRELLRKPDRSVDVNALNRADLWARTLGLEYWRQHQGKH